MVWPNGLSTSQKTLTRSSSQSRDSSGRFQSSGEAKAKPVQVWLKPDILERLDTYCAFYGVGRGRAIGHLLKGALPDPRWVPASTPLVAPAEEPTSPQAEISAEDENKSEPLFTAGDRVSNNAASRHGVIAHEPAYWVPTSRLPCGTVREGHWSYAVAWDGQMGLTIRYAEDLLRADAVESAC